MLRCATMLLALLLCLPMSGVAEAADGPFQLAEGLTWASTPEEAVQWLGVGAEVQENVDEDLGKLGLVSKDDLEFAGLPCGRAAIIYYNDAMVYATFYYTRETSGEDMQNLFQAAQEIYGEPVYRDEGGEDAEADGEQDGVQVYCRWQPDDETQLSILSIAEDDYPFRCGLFFENTAVEARLKTAMEIE